MGGGGGGVQLRGQRKEVSIKHSLLIQVYNHKLKYLLKYSCRKFLPNNSAENQNHDDFLVSAKVPSQFDF